MDDIGISRLLSFSFLNTRRKNARNALWLVQNVRHVGSRGNECVERGRGKEGECRSDSRRAAGGRLSAWMVEAEAGLS